MTAISQATQQYASGISQQPDLRKFPGQVKNIINGFKVNNKSALSNPDCLKQYANFNLSTFK